MFCYLRNGSSVPLIVFKPSEHVCSAVRLYSFHHESFTQKQSSFVHPVVSSKSLRSNRATKAARLQPQQQNNWLKVRKTQQVPGRLACGLYTFFPQVFPRHDGQASLLFHTVCFLVTGHVTKRGRSPLRS